MFGRLYVGELKKQAKPKTIIVVSIFTVVFFILAVVVYSLLADALSLMNEEIYDEVDVQIDKEQVQEQPPVSAENIDDYIAYQKEYIEELKKEDDSVLNSLLSMGSNIYSAKCQLALLEYRKAHNDYSDTPVFTGSLDFLSGSSGEGFLGLFLPMFASIVIIAGIAIGSGIFANEMKDGTLKLMFMRPVTRNQVVTAKLLALLTIVTGLLVAGTLIGYIYGVAAYGAAKGGEMFFIFNAQTVTKGSVAAGTMLMWTSTLIQVLAFSILAFSIGTLTKNKVAGLVISILIYFGIVSSLFSALKVGAFTFESAVDFLGYIGVGVGVPAGGNFYIAFFMFVAYIAGLLAATYLVFDKRDIT